MSDGIGGGGTLDTLQNALDAVRVLRCNMGGFFETISGGVRTDSSSSTDDRERNFRTELQQLIHKIFENFRDVDQHVNALSAPIGPFNLGNTMYVSQEVSQDRIQLYSELVDSYKWMEKVHEYSGIAGPILGQNSLKRTAFSASISAKRRRTITNSYTVIPPQAVDGSIMSIANSYKDMDINITRPLGSNAALCITLGRTLKAVVILKGWLIEWVVVRAVNEDMVKDDGSLELWAESRYKVFQKVTDNANAAMLHFSAPNHPELSVRSFMTWLHSYVTLFAQPCKKCGLHLSNNLPPTWRDLRTLEPYHEECKSS